MPREHAHSMLARMVDAIGHESFHATGTWTDESLGVYVGWSARRNSFADGMPVRNERGDAVLVFSGEEYPEPGTARGLKERGHDFDPTGASYLVHLSEEDPSFPASLNGRFHGLLANRRSGTTTLFNDRYGMHRLYYHEGKDAFLFAAEAKAILAVRPELRRVDLRGFGEFISCGCVLENRTLFEGVHLLPGAARWSFQDGSLQRKASYFHPSEWEEQPPLEPEAYYQHLREVFSRNLPRYFAGPEPIGMSLTGGLDSRMIMAWQASLPGSLRCYSFGGMFRDCEDVRVARRVARVCDQPYEVIHAGREFLAQFPRYAERSVYLSDGCADVSLCPDLLLYERARAIAPVRMTGNFGGEVLRGVRAFKHSAPLPGLFDPALLTPVTEAKATYTRALDSNPLSFAVFRQGPWHFNGVLSLEQNQLSPRTPYMDNDLVRAVYRSPASAAASNDVSLRLIEDGDARLRRIPTDRGVGGDSRSYGAAALRSWLALSFKAEYAYDYGMPQWLARIDRSLSPLRLERLFLGRHKFYHFRVWYRDVLSGYVRDMLLDQRALSRPYLERKKVEAIVNSHVKGDGNYTTEIHKLLTLEIMHRLFVDPSSTPRLAALPVPAGDHRPTHEPEYQLD